MTKQSNRLTPSDVVGVRIREVRRRRGWTAANLAERCAEIGAAEITASVVNDLETGRRDKRTGRRRRNVSVDEVLALAYALDVAPVQLVVPLDGRTPLQVTSEIEAGSLDAFIWVTGEQGPNDPRRRGRWAETIGPVDLHRSFWQVIEAASDAERHDDVERLNGHLRELGQVLDAMMENEITPPPLRAPRRWMETIRDRGWTRYPDEVR